MKVVKRDLATAGIAAPLIYGTYAKAVAESGHTSLEKAWALKVRRVATLLSLTLLKDDDTAEAVI